MYRNMIDEGSIDEDSYQPGPKILRNRVSKNSTVSTVYSRTSLHPLGGQLARVWDVESYGLSTVADSDTVNISL